MGSVISLLSRIRKACWDKSHKGTQDHKYGRPFLEMLRDHHHYGSWLKAQVAYEVKLIHRNSNLHWYLLLKAKGSPTLPYISMEITTSDMRDLVPVTRDFESYDVNQVSDLGTYEGTLYFLCQLADGVVEEMGSYHILYRNCQTFCNELLKKMGKDEFPTSLESELIDREFDLLSQVFKREPLTTAVPLDRETTLGGSTEKPEFVLSGEQVPLTINDLRTIHKILTPVQHKWMEIGNSLAIQSLDRIRRTYRGIANQCLREMLREYLQRRNPAPSWTEIIEAVIEYSHPVAESVMKEARRLQIN